MTEKPMQANYEKRDGLEFVYLSGGNFNGREWVAAHMVAIAHRSGIEACVVHDEAGKLTPDESTLRANGIARAIVLPVAASTPPVAELTAAEQPSNKPDGN